MGKGEFIMTKTGGVYAEGNIEVENDIVVGLKIQGAADDETVKIALDAMERIQPGSVRAGKDIKAKSIITGVSLQYFDPDQPDRDSFLAELQALRQQLSELAGSSDVPAEVGEAVSSIDEVVTETQKDKPVTKRIVNRLRETVEFIGDASKVLDAASKAGPLIAQAIGTATILYQAAQVLF